LTPFTTLDGVGCPLPWPNIDTDQIIPARFMRKPRSVGYSRYLLHDCRFDLAGKEIADFPLNIEPWRKAEILVAGPNFGCGSSREPAVYALVDFGIRAVVAPSFGDIFRNNAVKNGLLPVALSETDVKALTQRLEAHPETRIVIDLPSQRISCGALEFSFAISRFSKQCMIVGTDDIDLTLAHLELISAFEALHVRNSPWHIPRIPIERPK